MIIGFPVQVASVLRLQLGCSLSSLPVVGLTSASESRQLELELQTHWPWAFKQSFSAQAASTLSRPVAVLVSQFFSFLLLLLLLLLVVLVAVQLQLEVTASADWGLCRTTSEACRCHWQPASSSNLSGPEPTSIRQQHFNNFLLRLLLFKFAVVVLLELSIWLSSLCLLGLGGGYYYYY